MQSVESENSDTNNDPISLKLIDADYESDLKNGITNYKNKFASFPKESFNLKEMQLVSLLTPEQCKKLNEQVKERNAKLITIPETIVEEKKNNPSSLVDLEQSSENKNEVEIIYQSKINNNTTVFLETVDESKEEMIKEDKKIDKEESIDNINIIKTEVPVNQKHVSFNEAETKDSKNESKEEPNDKIILNKKEHTIDTNIRPIKKDDLKTISKSKEETLLSLSEPKNVFSTSNSKDSSKKDLSKDISKLDQVSFNFVKALKNYKAKIINIINDKNCELNKRVKQVYIINLVEDVRKRNYIITLMKKYGINYSLVIVDRVSPDLHKYFCSKSGLTRGELGCTMSHLWCLLNGIQNKLENILVFEDDIILHKDFINYFSHIYDKNQDSDFLLLGAHDFMFSKYNYKNVHNNIYKPEPNSVHLYGAHANYYSLKGMKRMFNIRVSQVSFFDKEYMLMFNHFKNSGVVYPNIVVANGTQSGLNHTRDFFTDTESEYFSKCFINFNFTNYNFLYINLFDNIDTMNDSDDYETLTEKYLYNSFHDFDKMDIVKKRLCMDFFTIEDIKNIVTNH